MFNQFSGRDKSYQIFGKEHIINVMGKPEGSHGSIFEIHGSESLKEIGLDKRFYFQAPDKFSLELPNNDWALIYTHAATYEQQILSLFLHRSIYHRKLVDQYDIEN
jgi:hypothetical protein